MKPGFGPVFQFRTAFSVACSVDDLWMTLNIVAGFIRQPGSAQKDPVSRAASPLVRKRVGP